MESKCAILKKTKTKHKGSKRGKEGQNTYKKRVNKMATVNPYL